MRAQDLGVWGALAQDLESLQVVLAIVPWRFPCVKLISCISSFGLSLMRLREQGRIFLGLQSSDTFEIVFRCSFSLSQWLLDMAVL